MAEGGPRSQGLGEEEGGFEGPGNDGQRADGARENDEEEKGGFEGPGKHDGQPDDVKENANVDEDEDEGKTENGSFGLSLFGHLLPVTKENGSAADSLSRLFSPSRLSVLSPPSILSRPSRPARPSSARSHIRDQSPSPRQSERVDDEHGRRPATGPGVDDHTGRGHEEAAADNRNGQRTREEEVEDAEDAEDAEEEDRSRFHGIDVTRKGSRDGEMESDRGESSSQTSSMDFNSISFVRRSLTSAASLQVYESTKDGVVVGWLTATHG